jgi:hypothetical protein
MLKVMMLGKLCSPLLLLLSVIAAKGQDWNCQSAACEGHKAGYSWGMNHDVTKTDCDTAGENTNSPSFAEGCKSAVRDKAWVCDTPRAYAASTVLLLGNTVCEEQSCVADGL